MQLLFSIKRLYFQTGRDFAVYTCHAVSRYPIRVTGTQIPLSCSPLDALYPLGCTCFLMNSIHISECLWLRGPELQLCNKTAKLTEWRRLLVVFKANQQFTTEIVFPWKTLVAENGWFGKKRSCNKSVTTCLFSYRLSWRTAGDPRLWTTWAPTGWLRTKVPYNNFWQLRRGEVAVRTASEEGIKRFSVFLSPSNRLRFSIPTIELK